jgi:hypothetical protein
MSTADRSIGSTLAVVVAVLAVVGTAPAAAAQAHPRIGYAASPPPPPPQITTPYPGATVTIDPRLYLRPPARQPLRQRQRASRVVYVPVPAGYSYYPSGGYGGGGVTDANGRPLYTGMDAPEPAGYGYGPGTPDLTGAPYLAVDGGAMVVDFGNGDVRTFPPCAGAATALTPDGQPRTIFYRPGSEGVILRAGQRGRVQGAPGAGARACYTTDPYGRMALDY